MWCDLESPAAYRETLRKARKPHVCGDCKGEIKAGERYLYISGIWDGSPSNYYRCQDCTHIRCEIAKETDSDNCMPMDGLRGWLLEYADGVCQLDAPWFRWVGMFNAMTAVRGGKKIMCSDEIRARCIKETTS